MTALLPARAFAVRAKIDTTNACGRRAVGENPWREVAHGDGGRSARNPANAMGSHASATPLGAGWNRFAGVGWRGFRRAGLLRFARAGWRRSAVRFVPELR